MKSNQNHWDKIFKNSEYSNLGWYEDEYSQTLKFLNYIPTIDKPTVFITGVGTSTLAQCLLEKEYKLILNDISLEAINKLKNQLSNYKDITYLCADISINIDKDIPKSDIWFDRAVLHFLLEEQQIQNYFDNLKNNIKKDGYALFSEFEKDGATSCAGLDVHRYSIEELSSRLGESFSLVNQEHYIYTNPAGNTRKYIYALYKRIS